MGTDIDIMLERKPKDGKWEPYDEIPGKLYPDDRDYKSWAFLFGVRGEDYNDHGKFGYRDWPKDTSFMGYYEDWDGDPYNTPNWYSYSYMTYEECKNIEWPDHIKENYFAIFCEYVWPMMIGYMDDSEHRILVRFNS